VDQRRTHCLLRGLRSGSGDGPTSFEGSPDDSVYYGHAGLRRFIQEWLAGWERYEAGAEEYLDIDNERVLVLCWQRGFGSGSQVPVEMDFAQLVTLKGGLIRRMQNSPTGERPSKPWGWGSRRCRGRTWSG
jgi:hypothetical protein